MNQHSHDPLSNAAWHSLQTYQADLGITRGGAARYAPDVSVFSALDQGQNLTALKHLLAPGDVVAVLSPEHAPVDVAPPFEQVSQLKVIQMVCREPQYGALQPAGTDLGHAHNAHMLALAQATDPEPFAINTGRMGRYVGEFENRVLHSIRLKCVST